VGVTVWVPYSFQTQDGWDGYDIRIFKEGARPAMYDCMPHVFRLILLFAAARRGGFTYTFNQLVKQENSSWDDALESSLKINDIQGSWFTDTIFRREKLGLVFAKPITDEGWFLLAKENKITPKSRIAKATTFLRPFSGELWLTLIGFLTFSGVFLFIIEEVDSDFINAWMGGNAKKRVTRTKPRRASYQAPGIADPAMLNGGYSDLK
jgi:hypothetical protein